MLILLYQSIYFLQKKHRYLVVDEEYQLKKYHYKKFIIFVLLLICITGVIYSIYNILLWKADTNSIDDQVDLINETTEVTEIADSEKTQPTNPPPESTNPYRDYIKIPLIDVNLVELKKLNSDTKGWIQVRGTNINFPFVQSKNNDFYLTHSFDKTRNQAGWVFLDYRNDINSLSNNSILYAHGRVGGTMFGTLKNIISNDWYSNKDNYIIRISAEHENTLWQVFSVYKIETTNDYLQTSFSNNADYQSFLEMIKGRSALNFDVSLNSEDKILTLSTCYNKTEKVVMHAKLIKKEMK